MSQLSDAHILNISTSIPILIYRRVLLLLPLHSHSSTPDITCRTILPAGERLEKGICKDHIIIGTPGRVYDVVKKKILDVSQMKVFVLDEADVMLNQENQMGKDVSNTRKALPSTCQVLFFSAPYPD